MINAGEITIRGCLLHCLAKADRLRAAHLLAKRFVVKETILDCLAQLHSQFNILVHDFLMGRLPEAITPRRKGEV